MCVVSTSFALFLRNRVHLEFNSYDLRLCFLLLRPMTTMYTLWMMSIDTLHEPVD
jgi:hypothetical protein